MIIEVEKPKISEKQNNAEMKKSIREKAIEEAKIKKMSQHKAGIRAPKYEYVHTHYEHLCPECQKRKQMTTQNVSSQQQYMEYPYNQNEAEDMYQYQYEEQPQYTQEEQYQEQGEQYQEQEGQYQEQGEQYQGQEEQYQEQGEQYQEQGEEQYQEQEQEEPLYDDQYQYQYQQEDNAYELPKYKVRTYQPRVYSLEERTQLLKTARPMFTVVNYGSNISNNTNTFNSASYNTYTYTQPPQKSEIIQKVEQVKKIMREDKAKTNVNKDIKLVENTQNIEEGAKEENKVEVKAIKKVEQKVEPKVQQKLGQKFAQKLEKKEERKLGKSEGKKIENQNQTYISSTCRYVRRDANRVIHKAKKIRQSSVTKDDNGKKNHLTLKFINILVEKPEESE